MRRSPRAGRRIRLISSLRHARAIPRINVDLPVDVHRRLKVYIAWKGTTVEAAVPALLDEALKRKVKDVRS